jgi:hypothetical protein
MMMMHRGGKPAMPFTVVHQGGTKDNEYRAYARLLSRQLLNRGISVDKVPRIRQNGSGNGWLYVWDSEDEAAAFSEELKKRTRDTQWQVQMVKATPSLGPLHPLQIDVGRWPNRWVFVLDPLTRMAIETRFPGSCRLHSVSVSSNEGDFVAEAGDLRPLSRQVLRILSGLGPEQLRTFESFCLVDPMDQTELIPPSPID